MEKRKNVKGAKIWRRKGIGNGKEEEDDGCWDRLRKVSKCITTELEEGLRDIMGDRKGIRRIRITLNPYFMVRGGPKPRKTYPTQPLRADLLREH